MNTFLWFCSGALVGYMLRPLIDVLVKITRNAWLQSRGRGDEIDR